MTLNLDPVTEQRIQREMDRGNYQEPAQVIAYALELLQAEQDWLDRNRQALNQHLDVSFAQAQRGETYTPEEARGILAERRTARLG